MKRKMLSVLLAVALLMTSVAPAMMLVGAAGKLDQSGLDAAIQQAEGLTEANYTPETWEALQKAVQAGKDLKTAIAEQEEAGGSTEGTDYVVNGGFEEDDMWKHNTVTGWTLSGSEGFDLEIKGDAADHAVSPNSGSVTLSQEISGLEDGAYVLSAGGIYWGSFSLAATSGEATFTSESFSPNGATTAAPKVGTLDVTVTGGSCTIQLLFPGSGAGVSYVSFMKAATVEDPIEQTDVDDAAQAIVNAIAALAPGQGEPDEQGLYWNILNVYLEQAAALVATDYTADSWAKLQEAVAAAEALIEKAANQVGSEGPKDYVTNGSFEGSLDGWEFVDMDDGVTSINHNWNESADGNQNIGTLTTGGNLRKFAIKQTIENVPAGTYTGSFYVKGAVQNNDWDGVQKVTKLTVACGDVTEDIVAADQAWNAPWTQTTGDVTIPGGTVTLTFTVVINEGSSPQYDWIQFVNKVEKVDQADIDAAATAVKDAMDALADFVEPVEGLDTTALRAAAITAASLKAEDYTPSTWAALLEAVQTANTFYTGMTAETQQTDVDAAAAALQAAIDALASFVELNKALESVAELNAEDYTTKTWEALQTAVKSGEALLGTDAAKDVIEAAVKAINDAQKALVNVSALNAALAAAAEIDQSLYSEASYQAVTEAVAAGEALLTSEEALTQQAVTLAAHAINMAVAKLANKPADTSALEALIAECEALNENDWDSQGWAAMTVALNAAKAVVAQGSGTATDYIVNGSFEQTTPVEGTDLNSPTGWERIGEHTGWSDWAGNSAKDGNRWVKNREFDGSAYGFSQTIENVPAGEYWFSVWVQYGFAEDEGNYISVTGSDGVEHKILMINFGETATMTEIGGKVTLPAGTVTVKLVIGNSKSNGCLDCISLVPTASPATADQVTATLYVQNDEWTALQTAITAAEQFVENYEGEGDVAAEVAKLETAKAAVTLRAAGDVNGDGVVNSSDARLVLQAIVKLETLDEVQEKFADANNDGDIDSRDARWILVAAVE